MKPAWKIYYADGTTFSALDGGPDDSPFKTIVVIGCAEHQWTLYGREWYYWHGRHQQWWNSDKDGLLFQLLKEGSNIQAIRPGSTVTPIANDLMWQAFIERMAPDE